MESLPIEHTFLGANSADWHAKLPAGLRLVELEQPGPDIKLGLEYGSGMVALLGYEDYPEEAYAWWPGPRLEWPAAKSPALSGNGVQGDWAQGEKLKKLLWEFMGLADAPAKQIFDFAGMYGVLGVGASGMPRAAEGDRAPFWDVVAYTDFSSPMPAGGTMCYERLDTWRAICQRVPLPNRCQQ